ncbi:MAG TPA: hypothetical protein DDZ66_04135 [Firmicutes bacterium]|jgi:prepilin-type N-terminal cleavage/methylation domain-containing protein|nr:hypothetical protein [Bacillota bacterium]
MLKKIRKMLKQQEGFTLVELMIVVVILGILSGIGIQQYGNVQERARLGVHDANKKLIENAVRMYMLSNGDQEPNDISDLVGWGLDEAPKYPWTTDPETEYEFTVEETGAITVTPEGAPS